MVAGGTAPLLFVWDLAAAELLYALHLPIPRSVYGTLQLHFMPDSQTVAGEPCFFLQTEDVHPLSV